MTKYKPHYACFKCRKTFKRRLLWDINRDSKVTETEAKCPQCGELMANMGLDFSSPKSNNTKQWEHLKSLYSVGITFHSCGCSGPGYIPNSKDTLIAYFNEILENYQLQLSFWRNRIEPKNEREINSEFDKNWRYIGQVPYKSKSKKEAISNEEAKKYWLERIQDIEGKLELINKQK